MTKYEIEENDSFILEQPYIEIASEILKENPGLPMSLDGDTLRFEDYTVGEIQIGDILITITPRNKALNLGVVFEMAAFVNSNSMLRNFKIPGYEYDYSFGISSVSDNFFKIIYLLLQYGLTGNLYEKRETSDILKGRLLLENFSFPSIPYKGLQMISKNYTINTPANQMIKAALQKLLLVEKNRLVSSQIFSLLRDFDSVSEYTGNYDLLDEIMRQHFSSNPYYPLALEYSILILRDLKLQFKNGKVDWYAFLENSNSLFEKYVFKVLKTGLKEKVEKWQEPKKYATLKYEEKVGYKYFSPDVILDYNKANSSCRAILDVKNKTFNPNKTQLSEIVEPADIYQIVFYCKRLNTSIGGLVYPSSEYIPPIQLMVDNEKNLMLYLLSINLGDSFDKRYLRLIEDTKNLFIYS